MKINSPALFFIRNEAAAADTFKALSPLNAGKVSDIVGVGIAAVVLEDALVGIDQKHKGSVKHGEDEMEGKADKEKLSDF